MGLCPPPLAFLPARFATALFKEPLIYRVSLIMFYLAINELFGVPLTRVIPALLSFPSLLLFPRFDVLLHITQTRSKGAFTTSAHLTQYLLREKVCFGSKREVLPS